MKRFLFIAFFSPLFLCAQEPTPVLLGKTNPEDFQKEPYATWYTKNFQEYQPRATVISELKTQNLSKTKLKIFYGSWCGDSKREVPRLMKILEELSFPQKNIELIGVYGDLEMAKQSPTREEAGLGIYRVPTFIFYEKEKEIGRIVEYPTESLELDFLTILRKERYEPNYHSYPYIGKWMSEGMLTDANVTPRGLAQQLLGKVQHESELNACGYVLMADKKQAEAITVFRINASLFPKSANCFDSLGEAYANAGFKEKAVQSYEQALKLDPASENAKEQLKKLKGE